MLLLGDGFGYGWAQGTKDFGQLLDDGLGCSVMLQVLLL